MIRLTVLLACLLAVGCGDDTPSSDPLRGSSGAAAMLASASGDDPASVVRRFLTARDHATRLALMRESDRAMFSKATAGKGSAFRPSRVRDARKELTVDQVEVDGERAEVLVTYRLTMTDGEVVEEKDWMVCVRESDGWRVAVTARSRRSAPRSAPRRPDPKTARERREWLRKQNPVLAANQELALLFGKVSSLCSADGPPPRSLDAVFARWPDLPRRDPWGNPWVYEPSDRPFQFRLGSLGSDGRVGGTGDAKDLR